MSTLDQQTSRFESGYKHLATKADIADLKSEIKSDIAQLESRLLRWMIGMLLASVVAASSVATLVQSFIN